MVQDQALVTVLVLVPRRQLTQDLQGLQIPQVEDIVRILQEAIAVIHQEEVIVVILQVEVLLQALGAAILLLEVHQAVQVQEVVILHQGVHLLQDLRAQVQVVDHRHLLVQEVVVDHLDQEEVANNGS